MSILNTLIPNRNAAPAAQIPSTVRPRHQIRETDQAFALTVYLPGVAKDGLEITAENDEIRIVGRRGWKQPDSWTTLYRESAAAPYELVLRHEGAVDADKIHAELRDGVLSASLPKAEAIKPRKIAVS